MRASKVIAGLEPTETNLLLQAIGKALDKKLDSSEYVSKLKSDKKGGAVVAKKSKELGRKKDTEKPKRSISKKKIPSADTETDRNNTDRPLAEVVQVTEIVDKPGVVDEPGVVAASEVEVPPVEAEVEAAPILRPKSAKPKSAKRLPLTVHSDLTPTETGTLTLF